MYPAGHDHGGVVQGIPVAIGAGRKGDDSASSGSSSGSWSGGSSPDRAVRVEREEVGIRF